MKLLYYVVNMPKNMISRLFRTVCIKFGSKLNIDEHVSINGFPVQWSESVRHLGNILTIHCLTHWIAETNNRCLLYMLINF